MFSADVVTAQNIICDRFVLHNFVLCFPSYRLVIFFLVNLFLHKLVANNVISILSKFCKRNILHN